MIRNGPRTRLTARRAGGRPDELLADEREDPRQGLEQAHAAAGFRSPSSSAPGWPGPPGPSGPSSRVRRRPLAGLGPVTRDEDPEDLVEREPLLAGRFDLDPGRAEPLDDVRQCAAGIVDDHPEVARAVLADSRTPWPCSIRSDESKTARSRCRGGRPAWPSGGARPACDRDDRAADDQGDLRRTPRPRRRAGS